MRFYYNEICKAHNPEKFFRSGKIIPHPEQPARVDILKNSLEERGFQAGITKDFGLSPLEAVHCADYLTFLSNFWERRGEIDPTRTEFLSTQFPRMQMHRRPDGLLGLLGYYTSDTSTPLLENTWSAAYGSAQTALSAAQEIVNGTQSAYALCRPPGHHAFRDCANGFCFLNNTAIAARFLREKLGGPIAILDIDVHHGNGTQSIFYDCSDIFTVSLHADTSNYFPFFAGYADEKGNGPGQGANLNIPLPHHSGDREYLVVLEESLKKIREFNPAALVVALGLDASKDDPLGVLDITTQGFGMIGQAIRDQDYPTLLVQEGGYLTPQLPDNLMAFLEGFKKIT